MKKILIIMTILMTHSHASESGSAVEIIKALFPGIASSKVIKTKSCAFQKDKWAAIILTKQSFSEKLTFSKNCDLQGEFTVKMDQFFPVNLKIRNLKNHERLISNLKFSVIFEQMPVLKLEMKDSILKGSKTLTFNMDYSVYIDPMAKDPFKKHKGGTLLIKRHGKKLLNKKVPLKFN